MTSVSCITHPVSFSPHLVNKAFLTVTFQSGVQPHHRNGRHVPQIIRLWPHSPCKELWEDGLITICKNVSYHLKIKKKLQQIFSIILFSSPAWWCPLWEWKGSGKTTFESCIFLEGIRNANAGVIWCFSGSSRVPACSSGLTGPVGCLRSHIMRS